LTLFGGEEWAEHDTSVAAWTDNNDGGGFASDWQEASEINDDDAVLEWNPDAVASAGWNAEPEVFDWSVPEDDDKNNNNNNNNNKTKNNVKKNQDGKKQRDWAASSEWNDEWSGATKADWYANNDDERKVQRGDVEGLHGFCEIVITVVA
jgi:hypothetical protein